VVATGYQFGGGNWWPDHTGNDVFKGPGQNESGPDNIIDTPYTVLGGASQDNYPLKHRYKSARPVINLNTEERFAELSDAITDGDTSDRDTIFAWYGEYQRIRISRPLNLVGADRNSTIIRGGNSVVYIDEYFGNNIINGDHGISLVYVSHVTIIGNKVAGHRYTGVYVGCESATLGNCTFTCSEDNIISGNTIMNNGYRGIYLFASDDNYITDNTIKNNTGKGLSLQSSSNNYIYHNNFINNTHHASGGGNYWDDEYPSGGNYWDDYNGSDNFHGPDQNESGGDCIGDTPYTIGANDRYPLLSPIKHPPLAPSVPSGPSLGVNNRGYTYTSAAYCCQASYNFSWGDGSYSGWLGPVGYGETISASHVWSTAGRYTVRVKIRSSSGYESPWSQPLLVRIFMVSEEIAEIYP